MRKAEKQTKDLKKILAAVLVSFVLLAGVMLAIVIAGNEASKETHADGSVLVSLNGEPIQIAPVESVSELWDLTILSRAALEKLNRVSFVYNMPSEPPNDPATTTRVEGSFVIKGFYRPIDAEDVTTTQLVLLTEQGYGMQPQ